MQKVTDAISVLCFPLQPISTYAGKKALFTVAGICTYIWAVLREAPARYEIMMAQYVC